MAPRNARMYIDVRNYEFRRHLNAVGINNKLLTVKLFHSGHWNRRILFLLVCFAFSFCHVLAFVRYIGLYIISHHRSGLLDCVRYNEEFVISRFFPIHFTVTLAGLKSTVRYTDNFIIWRFVKSRFHCIQAV